MYLAHSAEQKMVEGNPVDVPSQSYADHINGVMRRCENSLQIARDYLNPVVYEALRYLTLNAALIHDMGKLCDNCQKVLRGVVRGKKMPNHVDAGTAYAIQEGHEEVAYLVQAHHRGLINLGGELRDRAMLYYRCDWIPFRKSMERYTDDRLQSLIQRQKECVPIEFLPKPADLDSLIGPELMRLALSILVDADFSDTSQNYLNFVPDKPVPLRPLERLEKLKAVVAELPTDSVRQGLRHEIYEACLKATAYPYNSCNAVVGSGKTLSLMAFALRSQPSRIIYVAPTVAIISQNAKQYHKLVLDGETENSVIGQHHHQFKVEEAQRNEKVMSATWTTPIVCTTAVQFVESLASNHPSRLRKLHNLMGSHIIIDESHSIDPQFWVLLLGHLRFLVESMGCKVTFSSGSLVEPWTTMKFEGVVHPILPPAVSAGSFDSERRRVRIQYSPQRHSVSSLTDLLCGYPGPKLVVMNTVRNAALTALALARRLGRDRVEHISTALCPTDRQQVLKRVEQRLKEEKNGNWFLVGTSCIEAGVDFSFRHGFRELTGLLSVIQTMGRVNRNFDYRLPTMNVFRVDTSRQSAFTEMTETIDPAGYFVDLYRRYGSDLGAEHSEEYFRMLTNPVLAQIGGISTRQLLLEEQNCQWADVSKRLRVIENVKATVLIHHELLEPNQTRMPFMELLQNSVQIFDTKLEKCPIKEIEDEKGRSIKIWDGKYDQFLGYESHFLCGGSETDVSNST